MALLMQFYGKHIGELMSTGPDGVTSASLEKGVNVICLFGMCTI